MTTEPLTDSTFKDAVKEIATEIMDAIGQVPEEGELRARVALAAGMLVGLAYRVEDVERTLSKYRRVALAAERFVRSYRTPATPPDVIDDNIEVLQDALQLGR